MSVNPSPGFTPQGDPYRDLGMGGSRSSVLIEAANGQDPSARKAVRDLILHSAEKLPSDFFEKAAHSVKFYSVAEALLAGLDQMSYAARISLAEKFQKVGRDGAVITCLTGSPVQSAEGLWIAWEASRRGRLLGGGTVDFVLNLFAASFQNSRAEICWFQLFGQRGLPQPQIERAIRRFVDIAEQEQDPFLYHVLGEILLEYWFEERIGNNFQGSELIERAEAYAAKAIYLGYSPAKLSRLQHSSKRQEWDVVRGLMDFYREAYFPGLSWCYEVLRSEERPLKHIDAILTSYLWRPEFPVSSHEQVATALDRALKLSISDKAAVHEWALRNSLLVMDDISLASRSTI